MFQYKETYFSLIGGGAYYYLIIIHKKILFSESKFRKSIFARFIFATVIASLNNICISP